MWAVLDRNVHYDRVCDTTLISGRDSSLLTQLAWPLGRSSLEALRHAARSPLPIVSRLSKSGMSPAIITGTDPRKLIGRMFRRLQLQGELQSKKEVVKKYKGVLHAVRAIIQNEGPRGLFRGIGSAVMSIPTP